MLEFARIAVGAGSPCGCSSCGPSPESSYFPAEMVREAVQASVDAWSVVPGPNVLLTGPEPFDHPELPTLVTACVEAGAERVGIETDGAALSLPANATGAISAGVRHLFVRTPAAPDESFPSASGRANRSRDARTGVAAFLHAAEAAGVTVVATAVVPVCRHNLHALTETVLRAASAGMHGVRLLGGSDLPATAGALIAAACDTGMVNGIWVETDGRLPLPETHRLHVVPGTDDD